MVELVRHINKPEILQIVPQELVVVAGGVVKLGTLGRHR